MCIYSKIWHAYYDSIDYLCTLFTQGPKYIKYIFINILL